MANISCPVDIIIEAPVSISVLLLAVNEAREESDIDILVVGDVDLDELVDVSFPLLLKYGKLISAKDMKKSRFEKLAKEGYSFINNVLNEGVILYERMGKTFKES